MSSSLWSSGVAVHAYRLPLPNSAIIKAIINGSFEAPIAMISAQDPTNKVGPIPKANVEENINISDVDDTMSMDNTDEHDDKLTSASISVAPTDYFSFPVLDAQASSKDADVASTDKCHRGRKVSTDTTSSNNSNSTVNSNFSKNTANTQDTEYSQSDIAHTQDKRSQIKTPEHCDESGFSRDNGSPVQDETRGPTNYQSFPTLPNAPFSRGTPSPTPSDLACDSDADDYSSVVYASDDDYHSDNDSTKDELDDLAAIHTLDRPKYGLQYDSEVVDATTQQRLDDDENNGKKEREPKVKAVATSRGVEMVTYYSDDESDTEEEPRHPLAEFFCWKEEKDMGENWEVLGWYEHPDGNKSYVLGSDERWYWEYEGAFMLLLDEELEEFNYWRSIDPAAVLHWNGEVEEEKGSLSVCGLGTIQEEDEEIDEEVCEVKEIKEVDDRNGLATVWGLDVIDEEDEEACEEIGEVEEVEDHQGHERVWGLEAFKEDNEDDEDYKVFI
ncbi:hypothetical protein B0H65DRAFT_505869 [Neurospora tetraspora]|uniref:Uncharacterized protein n=1 Tax=Neurospora tetraspora TaxID=94610 RepID=A0AAE0JQS0_9PEZI|nr:hypothetical protein B0H65DRAFT_505869 [Neurospora tetraspora]